MNRVYTDFHPPYTPYKYKYTYNINKVCMSYKGIKIIAYPRDVREISIRHEESAVKISFHSSILSPTAFIRAHFNRLIRYLLNYTSAYDI